MDMPQHCEQIYCQCMLPNVTISKTCTRKARFRFVQGNSVKYSCGINSHMKTLGRQNSDFIQEKDKKGQWKTVPIFDYSFQKPKEEPPQQFAQTKSCENDVMIKQLNNIITLQKQEIAKLRERNTQLLSTQKNTSTSSNEISNKIITSTKLSLISAKSNENPVLAQKHLKLQLHPDKHPKELRWLFDELFKLINV